MDSQKIWTQVSNIRGGCTTGGHGTKKGQNLFEKRTLKKSLTAFGLLLDRSFRGVRVLEYLFHGTWLNILFFPWWWFHTHCFSFPTKGFYFSKHNTSFQFSVIFSDFFQRKSKIAIFNKAQPYLGSGATLGRLRGRHVPFIAWIFLSCACEGAIQIIKMIKNRAHPAIISVANYLILLSYLLWYFFVKKEKLFREKERKFHTNTK